jgi:cell division protein FtsB
MINVTHLTHAYRQAPWRVQRQWAGAFLLGVLALAMISALYLDVTAQTAIIGREIQTLQSETAEMQHENADLQTRLAALLSTDTMEARARALGFRPAEAGEIHYLVVPGYARPTGVSLAVARPQTSASSTPLEYTQSLLEWVSEYLQSPASGIAGGVLP